MRFITIKGVKGDTLHIRSDSISAIVEPSQKMINDLIQDEPMVALFDIDPKSIKDQLGKCVVIHDGSRFISSESAQEIFQKMQVH